VALDVEWRGETPPDLDAIPAVTQRVGLDLNPVDLGDAVERRWLRALVWPEDRRKAALLEAAAGVAAEAPPRVLTGDAILDTPRVAGELGDGSLVVLHSATRAHVPAERRPAFDAAIEGLGASRRLYRLSLEGAGLYHDPSGERRIGPHLLGLTSIDGETRTDRVLARVDGHAEWMEPVAGEG
jgi:hypothetical protein